MTKQKPEVAIVEGAPLFQGDENELGSPALQPGGDGLEQNERPEDQELEDKQIIPSQPQANRQKTMTTSQGSCDKVGTYELNKKNITKDSSGKSFEVWSSEDEKCNIKIRVAIDESSKKPLNSYREFLIELDANSKPNPALIELQPFDKEGNRPPQGLNPSLAVKFDVAHENGKTVIKDIEFPPGTTCKEFEEWSKNESGKSFNDYIKVADNFNPKGVYVKDNSGKEYSLQDAASKYKNQVKNLLKEREPDKVSEKTKAMIKKLSNPAGNVVTGKAEQSMTLSPVVTAVNTGYNSVDTEKKRSGSPGL